MGKDKDRPPGEVDDTLPSTLPASEEPTGAEKTVSVESADDPALLRTLPKAGDGGVAQGTVVPDSPGGSAEELLDRALSDPDSGHFKLREEIGRGGIGRVLLAFDSELGREVAIKELLPRFSSSGSASEDGKVTRTVRSPAELRFLDEARITAQLEHPGIVPVHQLGQKADGRIYYAMRLVRGQTLTDAIRGKPLNGRLEVLPQFTELCHAIAYAHSRGVVHRDLKPDNVMLGEFGETLAVDWGLARVRGKQDSRMANLVEEMDKIREDAGSKTVEGVAVGTPAYMPPEQAAGELDQIDERSDVYSLGAILYEILCGRPPHLGKSVVEVLSKVFEGNIVNPLVREPEASPELAAICMRALGREREDRYASAQELAEDVRRFQVGKLVHAHTYSIRELLWRWIRRHRAALAVATAMLAIALGVWWYRGWTDDSARARQEETRRARVAAEVERILADVAKGTRQKNWLDIYAFKLISLKEPLVERRLIRSLAHPSVDVRRLTARALGGMKSRRAVSPLCARLKKGVEPSETVVIAVINALGVIGDFRANAIVSRTRYRYGQKRFVWNNTTLAFSLIPLPPLSRYGMTSEELMIRALDLSNKGDLPRGIALLTRAIQQDATFRNAYLNRAILRRQNGDLKGAVADYSKAIALAPDKILGYYNRGILLRRMRNYQGALTDLNKVVQSGRRRDLALHARARLHHEMGKAELAIRDYRALIAMQPKRVGAYFNLALAWRDHERLDKAFEALNQALVIHPQFCKALTVRAAIRQFRGDLTGAIVDAERAVALEPDYLYAYTRRGQVLLARGKKKAALADFDKAVALKPKHAWRWGARAVFFHYPLGQYQKGKADLRQALKLATHKKQKKQHQFRTLLIALTLHASQPARAQALLRAAVPTHPHSLEWAGIRFLRGEITVSAWAKLAQGTPYWLDYGHFLQGLRTELRGDRAAARTAYLAAVTRYHWSNLWYGIAAHYLRMLQPAQPGKLPRKQK